MLIGCSQRITGQPAGSIPEMEGHLALGVSALLRGGGQEAAVAVCSLKVFLWVISASDDLTVSRETEHFHQRQGNHFIMVANNHYMSSQESSEDQLITFIKHAESTKCHRVLNIVIKNTLTNGKGGWVRNRALKHSKSHTGNNYYWILIFTPQNVISAYTAFVRPDRRCREESSAWRTDQQERILKKKNDRPLPAL